MKAQMMSIGNAVAAINVRKFSDPTSADVLQDITATLAKTAAGYDRSGNFPHENFDYLQQQGVIGLHASRELSGTPLTLAEAQRVISAVARGEPSTALVLLMTWLFGMSFARNPNWPPKLRTQVLQDIALNGALINGLRVEPALGSPGRGGLPATVARRAPGGWLISGHKIYCTGIPALKWLGVWGRTDDPEPLIGTFLVPAKSPGIRVVETWDQLGMRATGSHDVILENVFIPDAYAVDIRTQKAWEGSNDVELFAWMSVLLGALYDTVARNARDWLVQFVSERTPSNLGAPLSSLPRFQEAIGEIDSILYMSETILYRAIHGDSAALPFNESNFIKLILTNNAIKVTETALALVGNPALSRANPLERHHRDALCGRVHSPQQDTVLTGAGRSALAAFASGQVGK